MEIFFDYTPFNYIKYNICMRSCKIEVVTKELATHENMYRIKIMYFSNARKFIVEEEEI